MARNDVDWAWRLALLGAAAACASPGTDVESYDSPGQAIEAMATAADAGDPEAYERIFGETGAQLLRSGDPVADRRDAERVEQAISERVTFERLTSEHAGDRAVIAWLGQDPWPFPFPLVLEDDG